MNTVLQRIIVLTLRWGVAIACCLASLGGIYYLWKHGSNPLPDYYNFSYETAAQNTAYTSFTGILSGVLQLQALSWIQVGVLVLVGTPIVRILLSLIDFSRQKDWFYVGITLVVLGIIVGNSLQLFRL